jgi:shikimate dehydrogenase
MGAGGGARAVVYGLLERGAREIRLCNRTHARAKALATELGGPITVLQWEARHDAIDGAAMLVNATSQGMVGQAALDLRLDKLSRTALVADIIYIPRETPLIAAARQRGNRTVTGLGMLLHQGIPAWQAWFGITPAVTAELRARIEATL